jgi:hypothetical protein
MTSSWDWMALTTHLAAVKLNTETSAPQCARRQDSSSGQRQAAAYADSAVAASASGLTSASPVCGLISERAWYSGSLVHETCHAATWHPSPRGTTAATAPAPVAADFQLA